MAAVPANRDGSGGAVALPSDGGSRGWAVVADMEKLRAVMVEDPPED